MHASRQVVQADPAVRHTSGCVYFSFRHVEAACRRALWTQQQHGGAAARGAELPNVRTCRSVRNRRHCPPRLPDNRNCSISWRFPCRLCSQASSPCGTSERLHKQCSTLAACVSSTPSESDCTCFAPQREVCAAVQAAQQQVAHLLAELEETRKALADEQKQRQARLLCSLCSQHRGCLHVSASWLIHSARSCLFGTAKPSSYVQGMFVLETKR